MPVTSIVGWPSASRIRTGEMSVTSPSSTRCGPTSRSPTARCSVMLPFVRRKICGTSMPMPSSTSTGVDGVEVRQRRRDVREDDEVDDRRRGARAHTRACSGRACRRPRVVADPKSTPGCSSATATWQISMSSPARTSPYVAPASPNVIVEVTLVRSVSPERSQDDLEVRRHDVRPEVALVVAARRVRRAEDAARAAGNRRRSRRRTDPARRVVDVDQDVGDRSEVHALDAVVDDDIDVVAGAQVVDLPGDRRRVCGQRSLVRGQVDDQVAGRLDLDDDVEQASTAGTVPAGQYSGSMCLKRTTSAATGTRGPPTPSCRPTEPASASSSRSSFG